MRLAGDYSLNARDRSAIGHFMRETMRRYLCRMKLARVHRTSTFNLKESREESGDACIVMTGSV
jgi:hypothetical protein